MIKPHMSRIEMVMHLQSVDLFRSCAATEAVRLGEIAQPLQLVPGEILYRPNEPASTLFSVVEGRVLIEGAGGYRREIGPHGAFGVLEVLSGRQRSGRAEARTEALIVAIEGEDFFDLLSNNIDIVKALFREVLDDSEHSRSFEENTAGVIPLPVQAPAPSDPVGPGSEDSQGKGGLVKERQRSEDGKAAILTSQPRAMEGT